MFLEWCLGTFDLANYGQEHHLNCNFAQTRSFLVVFLWHLHCCSCSAQLCPTLCDPWAAARQASLSFTISQSLLTLMCIESVMPSNHLILRHPLLLLPLIFLSIRVFSNESVLCIRWPNYWSFSFSIRPSKSGLISLGWTGWISLQSKRRLRVFSSTTVQKHQFFGTQLSLYTNSHIHTWPLEKP